MTIVERPDSTATETIPTAIDETPWGLASPMRVRKRNGSLEPVDVNKIVRAVGRAPPAASTASTRCASPRARSAASTTGPPRWTSTS